MVITHKLHKSNINKILRDGLDIFLPLNFVRGKFTLILEITE